MQPVGFREVEDRLRVFARFHTALEHQQTIDSLRSEWFRTIIDLILQTEVWNEYTNFGPLSHAMLFSCQ